MNIFNSLRVRMSQGTQYIADVTSASPKGFRGWPAVQSTGCQEGCSACQELCPTQAIKLSPVSLDLGRCVFCNECALACPIEKISFTQEPKMGARSAEGLRVVEGQAKPTTIEANPKLSKLFRRSLKLRQVSAGGCNACELELNAIVNVNFDAQRFGVEWVASPRHADALVLTGPLTRNMRDAVRIAWEAMPSPRFLVVVGACAISGGLYQGSSAIDRAFIEEIGPVLYVPGCPPHPLTFLNAILDFIGATR